MAVMMFMILGGDHLIFRRTKGGSVVTENPIRGGSPKTLEGFRGGTTQISLENKDMGGIAKVILCYQEGSLL